MRTASSDLIVVGDIVSRHAIADYLPHCGYSVVEGATPEEAYAALLEPTLSIDVILCEVSTLGPQARFELASWVRASRSELQVKLASGVASAADGAAELCESGPNLARPHEPAAVVDYIKRLGAGRLK